MAYVVTNPPALIADKIGGGTSVWIYSSADAAATVNGAAYFSNGIALGMAVGDPVMVVDTNTPMVSWCFVTSVTATAARTAFGAVS